MFRRNFLASVAAMLAAAPAAGARRARAAAPESFGVQYWGPDFNAAALSQAPHDMLIIEASVLDANRATGRRERRFSPEEVLRIRRRGTRPALAYLNLAEVEPWRDHWLDRGPGWIAGTSAAGERLAPYWSEAWAETLRARIDAFLALGFDGALLDDALHYWTWGAARARRDGAWRGPQPPRTQAEAARQMMLLVLDLADHARRRSPHADPGFRIAVNNGAFIGYDAESDGAEGAGALFRAYREALDALVIESALTRGDAATLAALSQVWRDGGVPVLAIEFLSEAGEPEPEALRRRLAREAAERGFLLYLADDQRFDRLYAPVDPASLH